MRWSCGTLVSRAFRFCVLLLPAPIRYLLTLVAFWPTVLLNRAICWCVVQGGLYAGDRGSGGACLTSSRAFACAGSSRCAGCGHPSGNCGTAWHRTSSWAPRHLGKQKSSSCTSRSRCGES
ncbi:hypothetical protein EON66_01660 [archaeon]|nr:MAG: hypothetical protein EON66_01660 [archaeon]